MLNKGDVLSVIYEIGDKLGSGSGGNVFMAKHLRLNKDVVVKEIKGEAKEKLNIRAEADTLKNIKHTYLPQVYDFLEIDGEIYTIMDYIPGQNLLQELKVRKHFSQKDIIKWATQLTEALAYLHGQHPPIIHSDIKPENIMLTPNGDICLIDFNVSQFFEGGKTRILGLTHGYAAPEQYQMTWEGLNQTSSGVHNATEILQETEILKETDLSEEEDTSMTEKLPGSYRNTTSGSSANAPSSALNVLICNMDERADIYALGAALYHLVTGEKPGRSTGPVKPLSSFPLKISDGLTYIIEKAMEKDPDKRFASAAEMHDAVVNIRKLDGAYKRQVHRQWAANILFTVCFIGAAAATVSGWKTMGQERADHFYDTVRLSKELAGEQDYTGAAELAEEAVEMYPDRIDGYCAMAFQYYQSGDYEQCQKYIQDTSNKYSIQEGRDEEAYANLLYLLGNTYFNEEKYNDALGYFEEAITYVDNNSGFYRDYAISLARSGNYDKAAKMLGKAVDNGITDDNALYVNGEIAVSREDYATAEKDFLEVIQKSKDELLVQRSYVTCGQMYRKLNIDVNKFISYLNKASTDVSGTNNMAVLEMLGEAYTKKARQDQDNTYYAKAIDTFQQLLDSGYSRFYIMNNIALLYQAMGDYPNAERQLLSMKEKFPDDYRVYMQMAFLYAEDQGKLPNDRRNYQHVFSNYEKAMELYGQSANSNVSDTQMLMLEDMINELKAGGWQ